MRYDISSSDQLVDALMSIDAVPASNIKSVITDKTKPGYYSIWINNPNALPNVFANKLIQKQTELIYIGIATKSLHERLVQQDLNHQSASTFFRGIGSVLGYQPTKGSLWGKSNQNNYKFSPSDTASIIQWLIKNISLRFVLVPNATKDIEAGAIMKLCPLLNTQHNPDSMPELAALRDECRKIAQTPI